MADGMRRVCSLYIPSEQVRNLSASPANWIGMSDSMAADLLRWIDEQMEMVKAQAYSSDDFVRALQCPVCDGRGLKSFMPHWDIDGETHTWGFNCHAVVVGTHAEMPDWTILTLDELDGEGNELEQPITYAVIIED